MSDWKPCSEYPHKDYRDADGKWHGVVGPRVELRLANGRIVKAQFRSEPTKGGGQAWAFWKEGGGFVGTYDFEAFREIAPAPIQR